MKQGLYRVPEIPLYNNEDKLVRKFAEGDTGAFTLIYQRFYFNIYQFAKRYISDQYEAEDITADTFVKLWKQKETFASMDAVAAFLHVAARNACFDFLKHVKVRTQHHPILLQVLSQAGEEGFGIEMIKEELMKLIYAEAEKLPPKMKEIFLLSYTEGLKPAEIAERLNLSVQTVSNQKTGAIKLLRLALANKPILLALLSVIDL